MTWTQLLTTPGGASLIAGAMALTGAFIGGRVSARAAEENRRSTQALEMAAELISACEVLWSAEIDVGRAAFSLMNVQGRADASAEERAHYDQAWRRAVEEHREANWRARAAKNALTLLSGDLEAPAAALYASTQYTPRPEKPSPTDEETTAYENAQTAFVTAARACTRPGRSRGRGSRICRLHRRPPA